MKFDIPADVNPIDQLKVVGKPIDRIDGPLKTMGRAPYAYERHDVAPNAAYGHVVASAIAKGRISSMDLAAARSAPGVLAIVTAETAGKLQKGERNVAHLLGGPRIEHYHQAVALVVAETFEQARHAANLVKIEYARTGGTFDLDSVKDRADLANKSQGGAAASSVGDFAGAFAGAPVQLDATYRTSHESHCMMEPHATTAVWTGQKLTVWTSSQMVGWTLADLAKTLDIPKENLRVHSPFVGGGFGCKLFLRADVLLAALGARAANRPVKVALQRAIIPNNTTHRAETIQRIRIGATHEGKITAIGHESWSGNLPGGRPETAIMQTRALYAGPNRMTAMRLAVLDLPEANSMRAPGEAPGLAALEIAIDEIAEKVGMDPVTFRILNDTQVVPDNPPKPDSTDPQSKKKKQTDQHLAHPPFSKRQLIECLREGAGRFGWDKRRSKPGSVQQGRWLIGMGVAAAFRDNIAARSGARVSLNAKGMVLVETDMTDIGTGSYTILAQTAAEMMGVPVDHVIVALGDSSLPASCGSGGQFGGNNSTAGVYAACVRLREAVARRLSMNPLEAVFADGRVSATGRSAPLGDAAGAQGLSGEDHIEYGDLDKRYRQSTFGAHFVEVGVDRYTGETRVRRMLAVCAAGRILNPKTARSQVIGAMTMGVGAALMEHLAVDRRFGLFVNHDLAQYEVPVHADVPHLDVVFLDETDAISSPMKAKGIAELGICGVAAAVANAVYNATGIRIRDYPITLDKLIDRLPAVGS